MIIFYGQVRRPARLCVPASPFLGENVSHLASLVAVQLFVEVKVKVLLWFTTEYSSTDVSPVSIPLSSSSLVHAVQLHSPIASRQQFNILFFIICFLSLQRYCKSENPPNNFSIFKKAKEDRQLSVSPLIG